MQVRCIQAFGDHEPGDLVDVPDGSVVSPLYYEPVTAPAPAPPAAKAADTKAGA